MSKRKLPDYRSKQKILHIDKTSPEVLIRMGDAFLEEGALSDALDFFSRANHTAGIKKISEIAMQNGDVFLYAKAARALNVEPSGADWDDIAQRAIDLKKYAFARHAIDKTGNAKHLAALEAAGKAQESQTHE